MSLGTTTVFSQPEFFRIILKGLATLAVDVVVTVGAHNDPASLGPLPDTVHVARWLPLPALLSRCCLVVCHAGSGTVLASLAAGLPMMLLPHASDQFDNAAAHARAGDARVVPLEALDSATIARRLRPRTCLRVSRSAITCTRQTWYSVNCAIT